MNFIAIIKLLVQLLPIIRAAVDQIDDLFPQGGYGSQKLAMVKTIVEQAISVSDLGAGAFGTLWPIIEGTIANVVSLKKSIVTQ